MEKDRDCQAPVRGDSATARTKRETGSRAHLCRGKAGKSSGVIAEQKHNEQIANSTAPKVLWENCHSHAKPSIVGAPHLSTIAPTIVDRGLASACNRPRVPAKLPSTTYPSVNAWTTSWNSQRCQSCGGSPPRRESPLY